MRVSGPDLTGDDWTKPLAEGPYDALREEFLRLLTTDSETHDARRREFNQAIFWTEEDGGRAIWTRVDLGMVLSKFDKAVKNLERK